MGAKKKQPWPSLDHPCSLGPRGDFFWAFEKEGVGKWMRAKRKSRPGCPGIFVFLASILFRLFCRRAALGKWGGSKKRKCPGPPKNPFSPWVPVGDFLTAFSEIGGGKMDVSKKKKSPPSIYLCFCRESSSYMIPASRPKAEIILVNPDAMPES